MPETLDDLFAAVSADVAARTSAPGGHEAIAASRRRVAGVAVASAVAVLAAILSFTLLGGDGSHEPPPPASPTPTEGLDVGDVAVWYDDAGLHHGDVVEQTAVRVRTSGGASGLAVVRTGALYIDVVGEDVWFHPWRGEPRVVGHGSTDGAVADPDGDTAAWFEGSQLVVYDTGRLREVARVATTPSSGAGTSEHVTIDHGILQVSADVVVWAADNDRVLQLDIGTGEVTERPTGTGRSRDDPSLLDVHDRTELLSFGAMGGDGGEGLVLRSPGVKERRLAGVEARGRLSPDGRYVLAVTADPHGSRFVDVRTGDSFQLPPQQGKHYAWIGWSHASTAVIYVTSRGEAEVSELYACDAERRRCEQLPSEGSIGEVLLPAT